MQLQLLSTSNKAVQFAAADQTAAVTWFKARAAGAQVVMVRDADGGLKMLRRDELERYAMLRPQEAIAALPLHEVGQTSSLVTVRELETQLGSSGLEAIAMMRTGELVALVTRARSIPRRTASSHSRAA